MSSGLSLLHRIDASKGERVTGRQLQADPVKVLDGVMVHLQELFNIRQGSAASCPDYGLPDFNDLVHQTPLKMETELAKAIRDAIKNFEPRLTSVRVKHLPNEEDLLNLAFQIEGRLLVGNKRTSVSVETVMTESGRMRVQV